LPGCYLFCVERRWIVRAPAMRLVVVTLAAFWVVWRTSGPDLAVQAQQNEDCGVLEVPELGCAQELRQEPGSGERGELPSVEPRRPGLSPVESALPQPSRAVMAANSSVPAGRAGVSTRNAQRRMSRAVPAAARKLLVPVDPKHPGARELVARRDPIDYAFAALFYNFPSAANPRKLWRCYRRYS
jgi:hypothetical protein